jgi:hypothetical protein
MKYNFIICRSNIIAECRVIGLIALTLYASYTAMQKDVALVLEKCQPEREEAQLPLSGTAIFEDVALEHQFEIALAHIDVVCGDIDVDPIVRKILERVIVRWVVRAYLQKYAQGEGAHAGERRICKATLNLR